MLKTIRKSCFGMGTLIGWLLIGSAFIYSQGNARTEIQIPDIPGYLTLKCDFHMHTVFSDGNVWPDFRPQEAWTDGLDALAITDHIEVQPHKDDLIQNFNRSFEIALPVANLLNMLLVHAAEITKDMPPGHFNALFLRDAALLDRKEWREALENAAGQKAFIFWNHPGWKQSGEIPIWYPEHEEILQKGWMHGIEIVNERSYYPEAFKWALEKKLTLLGNSDTHEPIAIAFNTAAGDPRPLTLVFAREHTLASLREALFARRTAVYWRDSLLGEEQYLKPIFHSSVEILNSQIQIKGNGHAYLQIRNKSDVSFRLELQNQMEEVGILGEMVLPAQKVSLFPITGLKKGATGSRELIAHYVVTNFRTSPDKRLPFDIPFRVNFISSSQ
jgi:3',5'-nucleoside bisphosphate phosphatase